VGLSAPLSAFGDLLVALFIGESDMRKKQIRLECLRIAKESFGNNNRCAEDVLIVARKYSDFVLTGQISLRVSPEKVESPVDMRQTVGSMTKR
jgi:hypothetical protein